MFIKFTLGLALISAKSLCAMEAPTVQEHSEKSPPQNSRHIMNLNGLNSFYDKISIAMKENMPIGDIILKEKPDYDIKKNCFDNLIRFTPRNLEFSTLHIIISENPWYASYSHISSLNAQAYMLSSLLSIYPNIKKLTLTFNYVNNNDQLSSMADLEFESARAKFQNFSVISLLTMDTVDNLTEQYGKRLSFEGSIIYLKHVNHFITIGENNSRIVNFTQKSSPRSKNKSHYQQRRHSF